MNNTPMTRERLDAIQERVDKATIGPWVRWEGWDDTDNSVSSDGREDAPTVADVIPEKADAEFIYRAREDVPALLAEVERLRALTTVDDAMVERAAMSFVILEYIGQYGPVTEEEVSDHVLARMADQKTWDALIRNMRAAINAALSTREEA